MITGLCIVLWYLIPTIITEVLCWTMLLAYLEANYTRIGYHTNDRKFYVRWDYYQLCLFPTTTGLSHSHVLLTSIVTWSKIVIISYNIMTSHSIIVFHDTSHGLWPFISYNLLWMGLHILFLLGFLYVLLTEIFRP